MIKGFIYHRSALSVFLISRYFPRFTRSRACLEGERTRYPFVSRNPVIQSVGSERRLSLPYHGCVMLNREAGNGDDDEEEWWENKEEETALAFILAKKERKGGREKRTRRANKPIARTLLHRATGNLVTNSPSLSYSLPPSSDLLKNY